MKGKNLVKTPGELYAPTAGGTVVSADGVHDYRQGKKQEVINQELIQQGNETREIASRAAQSSSSMENIIQVLQQQGEQDIATALEHESRIEQNEGSIQTLQGQVGNLKLVCIGEEDYEELKASGGLDSNTLYFTAEEEEE